MTYKDYQLCDRSDPSVLTRLLRNLYVDHGYLMTHGYCPVTKKRTPLAVHRLVWSAAGRDLPPGFALHHINGDRQDNRVDNLCFLSPSDHRKVESGYVFVAGAWMKRCRKCLQWKDTDKFYSRRNRSKGVRVAHICIECERIRYRKWSASHPRPGRKNYHRPKEANHG